MCLIAEGGGGVKWGKNPQVLLIITRECPKNNPPPILRNLDNFPPGTFYSTTPIIRHKRIAWETFFFKNNAENEAGRLVPDFLFFEKVFNEAKASGLHLSFNFFRLGHTINTTCIKL